MTSPPPRTPREYLGKAHSLAQRVRVFWTPEALEVDQADNYQIRRRRVFFDEVLLVTLHSTRVWVSSLLPLILAGLTLLLAITTMGEASRAFLVGAVIFGAWAGLLGLLPVWVVSVFGRRTSAKMRFRMRPAAARAAYARICRSTAEAQRA